MSGTQKVLFVQGAGAATYDEWDARVADLRARLGDGWDVVFPRMPDADDPRHRTWAPAVREELTACGDDVVAVGHSFGGTVLAGVLAEPSAPPVRLLVLVAAPYVGEGGWPAWDADLPADAPRGLPRDLPVLVVHGDADEVVEPEHADRYAAAVPHAVVHVLPGRDHALSDDVSELAELVLSHVGAAATGRRA
ncbi:alpha/beta fold hydrolase [Aquipuribacter sp. SD81]|uniref:alpha/beta fold hydrolase n=1 Tax=Aquipuribacter sp. SD81 TaxID=3127703 RepID=UPI00301ABB9C